MCAFRKIEDQNSNSESDMASLLREGKVLHTEGYCLPLDHNVNLILSKSVLLCILSEKGSSIVGKSTTPAEVNTGRVRQQDTPT